MSSKERKQLILKNMIANRIELGSGVPSKNFDSEEVYELFHIANCIPELREKGNQWKSLF